MALPEPIPGLVIRYSYLWKSEARQGREEGIKDRPCAIVLAVKRDGQDNPRVMVAPITHTSPQNLGVAIEIPQKVGEAMGLDHEKSWIVTREVNVFTWPGPDIRNAGKDRFAFGRLPHKLVEQVRQGIMERVQSRSLQSVGRDETSPVDPRWKSPDNGRNRSRGDDDQG